MRIVLATTARARGGVWRHIEDLARGLQAGGHELALGLVPEAHELRIMAKRTGFAIAPFDETTRWRGWVWHGHLHDTYDRAFVRVPSRRRSFGPTVLTEHLPHTNASDPELQPGPRRPLAGTAKTALKRLQYRFTDRVIVPSASSKAFLERRYHLSGSTIDVVMHGVAPSSAPDLPTTHEGPVRVLCIGSVGYQKGHDLLVDAAEQTPEPRWRATVLGDGGAREALERRAATRGIVNFPGWSDDVDGELAGADIVCMPSRWESAGYAALEAMAAGRPVVASDVDGLREIVVDGVTGLLVPPGDVAALAGALDRLSGDVALRVAQGRAGRARAAEFTIDRMVDETLAIYAQLPL